MKKILLLCCFLASALGTQAQFGNEWIKASQKYLKFTVNQAGVYRVSYADIQTADASFLQTNPANWQLFYRGKEMAIRVVGQADGTFDAQDYVEFYGIGNDGAQDDVFYRPKQRLHPYQSLFSDNAAYFLTNSPGLTGKRMAELNVSAQGLTPESFHVEENVQAFISTFTYVSHVAEQPYLLQSYYEPGEGWSGPIVAKGASSTVQTKLAGRVANSDWPITLSGMVNGRDNSYHQLPIQLDATITPAIGTLSFSGFLSQTFQGTIDRGSIQNEQLTLTYNPSQSTNAGQYSVTYVKLNYPQTTDMLGQTTKVFHTAPNASGTALLSIQNVASSSYVYDITDLTNCRYITTQANGALTNVVISEAGSKRDILVTNQITAKPIAIQPIHFKASFPQSTNYLIITNATLRQSADEYAAYRVSAYGGSYKPLVVESDSLYDQFNYGEKSPLALRRFADYMLANSSVKRMFLIGRAYSYPDLIKTTPLNMVPTVGYPGSDILLTAGLAGYTINTPAIPTGRLSVTTNDEVRGYLQKVTQYEHTATGTWRKHIIHISGGKTSTEAQSLKNTMTNLANVFLSGRTVDGQDGEVTSFNKTNPSQTYEPIDITPKVNEGVSLVTYFGHASPVRAEMDLGLASTPADRLHNQYYPLMFFNGCGVGEIFSNYNTLSADWINTPQKGAVVVMAHSYYSYETPTTRYLNKLYSDLFATGISIGLPVGEVQQHLNRDMDQQTLDLYDVSGLLEMVLQGDPAVIPYPSPQGPLPVNLVSFTAKALTNQTVQLDWKTATEINNDYFMLERSKDLQTSQTIAQRKPKEGSQGQGQSYNYTDLSPYKGTSYYRLRQVDKNGQVTVYPWASVVVGDNVYGVHPNPVRDSHFTLGLDEPQTAVIKLYSRDGRLLPLIKTGVDEGSLELETGGKLPAGVYILTVEERGQIRKHRLVVE